MQAQTPGAPVPFIEFNAATSAGVQSNGTLIGPNLNFGTLAAEATGREAIVLSGAGAYIQFTLTAPANAVTIHYAIPDAVGGGGMNEPLDLYVNGTLTSSLTMTSKYSWLYGAYNAGAATQFSKTPTIGLPGPPPQPPHDFYNDVRYIFSSTLPAGTVVKLQVDAGNNSPWYVINTADFEVVPAAIAQPSGSINAVTSYSADPTGSNDSTTALQNALNAASNATTPGTVYLPAGTYTISQPLNVNNVTVMGAGEWYTVLTGSNVEFSGATGGSPGGSTKVNISNLAIFGNVPVRVDTDGEVNGINGGFSNSTFSNMWIQNTKVGAWVLGPTTTVTFNNMRIMDLKADGINFNAAGGPISGGTVENSFFRNTQDDGVAMWAENAADTNITVNQNTILSPGLANNVAIYGAGENDMISNNVLADVVTRGSCFQTSLGVFTSVGPSGPVTIKNNLMERCGQWDPGFDFGTGAFRFFPLSQPLTATFNISGNTIENSAYAVYQFLGADSTTGVAVTGDTVSGVGTYVVQAQGGGSATIDSVSATGVTDGGYLNLGGNSGFTLSTSGETGWSASPAATATPPGNPLWVYPDLVTFPTTANAPVTEQIAVINNAYQTTTIGPFSASAGFTVVADPSVPCGSSLAAATNGGGSQPGYCLIDVTFNGSGSGITKGTLTIPNSAGSTVTVLLIGSTGGSTLAVSPPTVTPGSLSFGNILLGSTVPAQTVTLSNPTNGATTSVSIPAAPTGFTQTNNCGSVLGTGSSCTITVSFAPATTGTFTGSLAISTESGAIDVALTGTADASTTNLALGATATSSSAASGFPASNVNDGNTSTYWESLDGASYPQTITLNFGQSLSLGSVTLDLPPLSSWATRSETLSVLDSTNGTTFTTIIPSASYTFTSPANTVSFNLPSNTNAQYLQLSFTANTGWTAAQLSELEVFPGTKSSCTASVPAGPAGLTATEASSSSINLSWTASSTGGVTYSVFASTTSGFTPSASNLVASGLTATTYSNTGLTTSTTYYYIVQAVNCAGSASSSQASATTASGGSSEGPYGGTPAAIPGTVKAENYDTGGQGVAYNVTSVNGTDNSYRSDGVDLETATSPATGNDLGWTGTGQYFRYTVNVATAGTYTVSFLVAGDVAVSDAFHLSNSAGTNLTGSVAVPSTGGWQTWTTITATVTLPAGTQTLTLDEDNGGWNFDTATFALAEGPFGGTPAAIPGTVKAENYDTGGQGVAYNVTSVNGTDNSYRSDGVDLETATSPATGNDLGWTGTGQYFRYTVNVSTAGKYTVSFLVAGDVAVTDAFHLSNPAGTNLTGSVAVPSTGGWQTWTTITATVTLPAGTQVLTLNEDNGGWNIDSAAFALQ